MTESALALYLSDTVAKLKSAKMLNGTVTWARLWGRCETVNIYSALIAAEELAADVIFLAPGPGVVGTGTRYGFSGSSRVNTSQNNQNFRNTIFIPRISLQINDPTLWSKPSCLTHLPGRSPRQGPIFLFLFNQKSGKLFSNKIKRLWPSSGKHEAGFTSQKSIP